MNYNPTEKEIDFVNNALQKFNDQKVGPDNHELLNIIEYDNDGNIIAGILAGTYWGWMHVEMILSKLKIRPLILRIILTIVCLYGVYAFMSRGVWKYLILRQQFFFFDLEKGYVVFVLDYIAIIFLFAAISHIIAKLLQEKKK